MGIFHTIGMMFVIFTSAFGAITIGQHAWRGFQDAKRQRERGAVEEIGDVRRASEGRFSAVPGRVY